jgi:hypothetical protein
MNTNNNGTQISEPSPSSVEKRNSSKHQRALKQSLDELELVQMEDEVKNVLVTIINIVMNSEDAEAIVRAS